MPFQNGCQDEWERVIACDLRAVFFLSQMVCKQMVGQSQQGGSIVNISSVHSLACLPGAGPYDAAKWGVVGMGKSIAVELAGSAIRVNALSPGLCNTAIWDDLLEVRGILADMIRSTCRMLVHLPYAGAPAVSYYACLSHRFSVMFCQFFLYSPNLKGGRPTTSTNGATNKQLLPTGRCRQPLGMGNEPPGRDVVPRWTTLVDV
jgi:NAD(P)-dependent dehydrogenase (short-subunit alcohol dehydrogenase family)